MRIVIVGRIQSFLPRYGIAWATENVPEAINLSEITDCRCSSYLKEWIKDNVRSEFAPVQVFLVTQSATLKDEVTSLFHLLLSSEMECELIRKSPTDIQPLDDSNAASAASPITQSYRLLPELSMESRGYFRALFPEVASCINVNWIGRLSPRITTLTRYNAFMLGVIESAQGLTTLQSPSMNKVSLASFLSKCSSSMGKRRIEMTLLHPLMDIKTLEFKLAFVKHMMNDRILRNKIQNVCISKCIDVDKLTYQLHTVNRQDEVLKKRLVINNFAALSHTISSMFLLVSLLQTNCKEENIPGLEAQLLSQLVRTVGGLKKLQDLINHVFVIDKLEAAIRDPTTVILNPNLVDVAAKSKAQIDEINEAMERIRAKAENDLCGTNSGKIKLYNSQGGKVLRAPKSVDVTNKYKLIRVNKAETQFTTSKLEELNERLGSSTDMVESCERAFIAKALEVTCTYHEPLKELADMIGAIDVMCAIAAAVSLINQDNSWCIPDFLSSSDDNAQCEIHIEAGRHPLLEVQETLRGRTSCIVPNDALLNPTRRSLLITGPNMGGKSTYARQVALHCVLAQTGIPCPSKSTRITPMELLWTRVGAHDSPAGGASTFMTEASETAAMLAAVNTSKGPCCVVLDELGRGTSACDGLAFAAAVLRKLLSMGRCLSLFATHFHELALMPLEGVHALSMASPSSSLVTGLPSFTYKLEDGVESDSDGILLAKAFGFPSEVIEQALLLVNN